MTATYDSGYTALLHAFCTLTEKALCSENEF